MLSEIDVDLKEDKVPFNSATAFLRFALVLESKTEFKLVNKLSALTIMVSIFSCKGVNRLLTNSLNPSFTEPSSISPDCVLGASSKAGIIGFSKSVALELGSRNIRSNVIAPGFIETEMTAKLDEETVKGWRAAIPLKRGGTPEDIANACVYLASDLSAYVTGQTLNVDGGMLT